MCDRLSTHPTGAGLQIQPHIITGHRHGVAQTEVMESFHKKVNVLVA